MVYYFFYVFMIFDSICTSKSMDDLIKIHSTQMMKNQSDQIIKIYKTHK